MSLKYTALPEQARYTLPFNMSAGTPLGDTPLIAATLQLPATEAMANRIYLSVLVSPSGEAIVLN